MRFSAADSKRPSRRLVTVPFTEAPGQGLQLSAVEMTNFIGSPHCASISSPNPPQSTGYADAPFHIDGDTIAWQRGPNSPSSSAIPAGNPAAPELRSHQHLKCSKVAMDQKKNPFPPLKNSRKCSRNPASPGVSQDRSTRAHCGFSHRRRQSFRAAWQATQSGRGNEPDDPLTTYWQRLAVSGESPYSPARSAALSPDSTNRSGQTGS